MLFAPNACRGERCGVWGCGVPIDWLCFSFGAFPLRSSGRGLFSPSGNLLSAGAFGKSHASTMTYSGVGRGTSTLNLQSGLLSPRGASESAPFPSLLAHRAILSLYWHRSRLSSQPTLTFRTKPSSSAFTRPGAIRQRSTARRRASATMAFLRAAAQVFGPSRTAAQRRTARVARLKAADPPGQLNHQATQPRIAMLGDRTQASALCAAALARTKSKVVAHLPGIAKSLWIDQFAR